MGWNIRGTLLPAEQRRTLDELTEDLDLRSGDRSSKATAFWLMLSLAAVIASAGILRDSTATVIGAMIIAPLSTPIMGTALALVKRQRNGSAAFVAAGVAVVVAIGFVFSYFVLPGADLTQNSQIAGRTSPSILDMIAALATGLAGSVAMARRDVAAVLPGVAIAISLVPPLAVVGICLGNGEFTLAFGALVLFVSNLLALVLAGTFVFAVLGYAKEEAEHRGSSKQRYHRVLAVMLVLVSVPLVLNTVGNALLSIYESRMHQLATRWLGDVPGARVTDVEFSALTMTVSVETPSALPPPQTLADTLPGQIPDLFGVQVRSVLSGDLEVRPSGG
ncbi:MAG: TIGR00341 family protein [Actinomycetales bacterium]